MSLLLPTFSIPRHILSLSPIFPSLPLLFNSALIFAMSNAFVSSSFFLSSLFPSSHSSSLQYLLLSYFFPRLFFFPNLLCRSSSFSPSLIFFISPPYLFYIRFSSYFPFLPFFSSPPLHPYTPHPSPLTTLLLSTPFPLPFYPTFFIQLPAVYTHYKM